MSIDEIRKYLKDAITRSGYSQSQVAAEMHLSKSNITNWLTSDREIPLNRLLGVMNYLDDDLFRYQVAEYLVGLPLLAKDKLSIEIPQTRLFAASQEEKQRKALDDHMLAIFNKPAKEITQQDFQDVERYFKEFSEEVESEDNMLIAIRQVLREWAIARPQGGVAYGSYGQS